MVTRASIVTTLVKTVSMTRPLAGAAQQFTGVAAELWQTELTHWELLRSGELREYMQYFHRDYLGWPCFVACAVTKTELAATTDAETAAELPATFG